MSKIGTQVRIWKVNGTRGAVWGGWGKRETYGDSKGQLETGRGAPRGDSRWDTSPRHSKKKKKRRRKERD